MRRHLELPDAGILLISTDIHGNLEDFEHVCRHFERLRVRHETVYWVMLGDLIHGPDAHGRTRNPTFYDYPDQSVEILRRVIRLTEQHPGRVFFVMGNHEWSHVGGPKTRKFHLDEAAFLEQQASEQEIEEFHAFFNEALLTVATPCGALLCHGAPAEIEGFSEVDDLEFEAGDRSSRAHQLLSDILTSYGQPRADVEEMLARLSNKNRELSFIIHGHDRDAKGFFVEEENQFCPVIFGAPRENKRILVMDLSRDYAATTLAASGALVRLYGEPKSHSFLGVRAPD